MSSLPTFARWIAGLLAVSAIVFALAVSLERHETAKGSKVTAEAAEGGAETGSEAGERAEQHEISEAAETLLGINLESPWLTWGFVVVSFAGAIAVRQLWAPAFTIALVLAGSAAVLDFGEAFARLSDQSLIAVLALLIGAAHVAAAVLAIIAIRKFPEARWRLTAG